MKILLYISCLLFSFIYSFFNYGISINAIFSCILIIFFSFTIFRKSKYSFQLKPFLLSILLTFICLICIPNNFIFGYKNEEIIIKNNDTNTVRISIFLNDNKQVISSNEDEIVTDYNITNKLTGEYYYDINPGEQFVFNSNYARTVKILFEKDNYNKNISINDINMNIPIREYDDNTVFSGYNKIYYTYDYDNISNFNLYLFVVSCVYIISMIYILSVNFDLKKLLLFLCLLTIEYSGSINLNYMYKLLVFLFIYIYHFYIDKRFDKFRKNDILICICSFLTTFCLIGSFIINDFSLGNLFLEINFWIINFIILYFFMYKFNVVIGKNTKYSKTHKYIIFFIVLLFLLLIKYFIGDCYVHPDGTMQLKLVINNEKLDDWHPFMHTLFIKLCNNMFNNNSGLIYIRILSISFLLSWILDYFYKKGLNIKICYLITFFFIINPVNIVYIMTLVKDVDYVIVLIAVTFLLMKLHDNKISFYKNKLYIILLSILLVLLGYFRHNGLFICIVIFIMLIIKFIKDKKIGQIIILTCIISSLIGLREFLRYKLNVWKTPENFIITTVLHGIDYLYVNDKLDDSDKLYLESIMDGGLWTVGYNKYNIDRLIFYNEGSLFYKELDRIKFIQIYIKNLFKHPILLINDRLYGTDILWNTFGSDYIGTYKYHLIYDEYGNDWASSYDIKRNNNKVTDTLHNALLFLGNHRITDAIFFRAGIYTLLLFVILFYLIYIKKYEMLLIFLPCIVNNATLLITSHHQSYRYVMHMPFIVILGLISILLSKKE